MLVFRNICRMIKSYRSKRRKIQEEINLYETNIFKNDDVQSKDNHEFNINSTDHTTQLQTHTQTIQCDLTESLINDELLGWCL